MIVHRDRTTTCLLAASLALLCACGEAQPRAEAPASTPAVAAAPAPAPAPTITPGPAAADGAIKHLAVGAKVIASSTHDAATGEGTAASLVDGDPTTRWSSAYADNQEVVVDLGEVKAIGVIRLMWEKAAAKSYAVQISPDDSTWSAPITSADGGPGPRTDDITFNAPARFIKLSLKERATEWGFSLYEIVVLPPK